MKEKKERKKEKGKENRKKERSVLICKGMNESLKVTNLLVGHVAEHRSFQPWERRDYDHTRGNQGSDHGSNKQKKNI